MTPNQDDEEFQERRQYERRSGDRYGIGMENHELKLQIGLLEKDIQLNSKVVERISESIEKMQEVNINLLKMIALHDEKHVQHIEVERTLKDEIRQAHTKLNETTRELEKKITELENSISDKLEAIKQDLISHRATDESQITKILREIDKYKWTILGIAMAAGWILGNINLDLLGKFVK